MLATCLLLSGAPGFGSLFRSPQPISLSLLFPDPALSPLGLFLVGSGVCLWCLRRSCCASLSFLWDACLYPSGSCGVIFRCSLYPAFVVGSSFSVFPWHPPSPFFRFCPGHWVVFLALSSACRLVTVGRVFTVPCGLVWCFSYLPCGPYARPLFGLLAVPPFLPSRLVGMYSPRL